ncbi:PREDICTED: salivary glue protein Sgs-3-like [Camelina sativa]|uniref:Salivary glue protein Sgs-3-like n=1 Tax=Camelina sativa TaxID=90675 RepID=A0ABM1R852_CAMSA|nr:PREDICTED: salivary glue protein Sgs-3-like [Camelina sativa]
MRKKEEGSMKFKVEKKMSLEEYVDFFSVDTATSVDDFTISYLNQIIHMHGFRKLHKAHKKILGEVVDALDLIDPSRSTLNSVSSSSSSSSLTLDEVITDIEALKWQECCFTSLQIINSDSPVPKPYQTKSNKRKKPSSMTTTTMKKPPADDKRVTTTTTTTAMISSFPRKVRTKKTMKTITSVNEAASAPKPLSHYITFPSRFPTTIP